MTAYSFKRQFVEPIKLGTKCQTIRAPRRRHARPGEKVQLYCGMRTQTCFLIAVKRCIGVIPIKITFAPKLDDDCLVVAGSHYSSLNEFAIRDGFASWPELRDFWRQNHGLDDFSGVVVMWEAIT